MKSRRIAAALTLILVMCQAPPAYADLVVLPTTTGAGLVPDVWAALFFVGVVSGISFLLLRRIARRRAAVTPAEFAPGDVPVPPMEGSGASDGR
jgi:hypothetical protein